MARRTGITTIVGAVVAIAWLTLTPQPPSEGPIPHTCLVCGPAGMADVLANVLLFLPLGFGLSLTGVPWRRAVLVCAATSVAIELTQYLAIAGRYATVSDVVTNTLGGAIGGAMAARGGRWLRPEPRTAVWLTALAAAAWLCVLAGSAWGFGRDRGGAGGAVGPSALPFTPGYGWFAGAVEQADVDGRRFVHRGTGPLIVAGPVDDTVYATVTVSGRDRRGDVVPMLYLHSADEVRPKLILGQRGSDAVLVLGTRGGRVHLRQPIVSVRGVLGPSTRASPHYRITGSVAGDALAITYDDGVTRRSSVLRLSPMPGWALLVTFPTLGTPMALVTTMAWLAALALPLGYWATWTSRRGGWWSALAAVAVVLGLGLVAVPRAGGFAPASASECAAAVGGAALGAALAAVIRRRAHATRRGQAGAGPSQRTWPATSS